MKYIVDIDNTICETIESDYKNSKPINLHIDKINRLYQQGNYITYWTARGSNSGIDWSSFTVDQLAKWGCLYHEIKFNKPSYDLWIDDKSINIGFFTNE